MLLIWIIYNRIPGLLFQPSFKAIRVSYACISLVICIYFVGGIFIFYTVHTVSNGYGLCTIAPNVIVLVFKFSGCCATQWHTVSCVLLIFGWLPSRSFCKQFPVEKNKHAAKTSIAYFFAFFVHLSKWSAESKKKQFRKATVQMKFILECDSSHVSPCLQALMHMWSIDRAVQKYMVLLNNFLI